MPSYITIAEGQAYMDLRLHTRAWECASASEQTKAIAMATNIIDRLNYLGCKTDAAQVNQFPRLDDTDIPQDVKNATSEIALALLDGVEPELEYENLQLRSQGIGTARSNFNKTPPPPHTVAGIPSVTAWRYLMPYLRDPNELDIFRIS